MEHAVIEDLDRQLLNELQQEFPLSSRPFALIGNKLGISENETLSRVTDLSDNGIIRQISAIFDTRQLGYDSCLVAMQFQPQLLDAAAEEINKHQGVSHNYSRSHIFNLWFTIATPPGVDLIQEVRRISNITRPEAVLILPALQVFKIRVQLDVTGNRDPFAMEPLMSHGSVLDSCFRRNDGDGGFSIETYRNPDAPSLSNIDISVIRKLQENLPLTLTPFREISDSLGLTEDGLFSIANRFISEGRMRRLAAVLRHRKAGFKANAMGVWNIPPEDIEKAGRRFADFQAVSHCYERPSYPPLWPFNLFTMVHGHTREECISILQMMSDNVNIREYDYLFSEKEYKKVRLRYFV